ncbi:Albumin-2 [Bienertia sinuspersici]
MSSTIYLTAAFKSVNQNHAYIFMKNEYVLEDYEPDTRNDTILYGPYHISDVFSSLEDKIFATNKGINCAFASHDVEVAYIFSGNMCAKWFYAPDSSNDKILEGPKPIVEMLPFFRGTLFENGVDAAFESSRPYEAYLFKGKYYARINYSANNGHLINLALIGQFWPCLRGTTYENGFDAAFALHATNEAYLFKGEYYARMKFTPGATKDVLRWSGKIKESWPNLGSILPRNNNVNCKLVAN